MKRFWCAAVILIITVTSAVLLNERIIKSADEMINVIELNENSEMTELWNKNRILFSLMLTEEKTEKIRILIDKISKDSSDKNALNELKEELESVKNVLNVSVKNIL